MAPRAKAAKTGSKKVVPAKKSTMSDSHKEALALGREQGRLVRRYVDALEANRPKRGRKRTLETVSRRLKEVERELETAQGLDRVHLIQQRMDLRNEMAVKSTVVDLSELEKGFVAAAADYGRRKGITYAAWREAGVPTSVLSKAGIGRNS
jgi:hypothetical protein